MMGYKAMGDPYNRKIKLLPLITVLISAALLFTACGSSGVGKVKDGIYSNSMFKVTTPAEGKFRMLSGEQAENTMAYSSQYVNSAARGANKSFVCEYAAKGSHCDILVLSEDNVHGYTLAEFAEEIEKGSESSVISDISVLENTDITVNGVSFRHIACRNDSSETYWDYYIKQSGKKFVYIYISYIKDNDEDYSLPAKDAISAP